jgi:hypothetical protein
VLTLEAITGTLAVRSDPPGASILLNGKERAERTPAVLQLPPGEYKLEVVREGALPHVEDVRVKDGGLTNVEVSWRR